MYTYLVTLNMGGGGRYRYYTFLSNKGIISILKETYQLKFEYETVVSIVKGRMK